MNRHSQGDEQFGVSFVCLEGRDWGMQSPEQQDHPAGLTTRRIINPFQNPQNGVKQTWDLRNGCTSSCLETIKETAPALLWKGQHCHRGT